MRRHLQNTTMGKTLEPPTKSRRSRRKTKPPNWSQLETELLELILKKLPTAMDILRFKAVCSPWRSAANSYTSAPYFTPPRNPCIMFQVYKGRRREYTCLYDPAAKTVYKLKNVFNDSPANSNCLGSSHGWLAFLQDGNIVYLYNPISRACIRLPAPFVFPRALDSDSERSKAIVSSNPSTNNNFLVAVLVAGSVILCKYNERSWLSLLGKLRYEDIMFRNDHLLYAITFEMSSLEVWDCSKSPPVVVKSMSFDGSVHEELYCRSYLAQSMMGDILRVVKCHESNHKIWKFRFYVEKLDVTHKKWEKAEALDDQVLFVFRNQADTLSGRSISVCEGNSVYNFDLYQEYQRFTDYAGHAVGHHSLEDDGICKREHWMSYLFAGNNMYCPLPYCAHQRLFWFVPTC